MPARPRLPRLRLMAVLVIALLLPGCASTNGGSAFRETGDPDGVPPFELTVRVVGGAPDETGPVPGARVAFRPAGSASVENVTNAAGEATFTTPMASRATVRALADGWLATETVNLRLGRPSGTDLMEEVGRALGCLFTFGAFCFTGDDFLVEGTRATIVVTLPPPLIEVARSVSVPAHPPASPAGPPDWWSLEFPLSANPDTHALLMQHVRSLDATLAWENALQSRADLELKLACTTDSDERSSNADSGPAGFASEGPQSVGLSWEPDVQDASDGNQGWVSVFADSPCKRVMAGPLQDAGGTGVDADVTIAFTLREAVQVPSIA